MDETMAEIALPAPLSLSGESNLGLHRKKNEDSFCLIAPPRGRNQLAVIADGVGGHADGELASFLCCRRLLLNWRNSGISRAEDSGEIGGFLRASVAQANREIYEQNRAVHHSPPMCTTVVAAVFSPEAVHVAHVGDSRFYVFGTDGLCQVTVDHSLRHNGLCNVISRAVGPLASLEIDLDVWVRRPGDQFLLCSDGLVANIDDGRIAECLSQAASSRDAVHRLMRAALVAGGIDNITVVSAFSQVETKNRNIGQ